MGCLHTHNGLSIARSLRAVTDSSQMLVTALPFPTVIAVTSPMSRYTAIKVKVKVTLVQALRLCTGRTAHRGSRGIALLFHDQRH